MTKYSLLLNNLVEYLGLKLEQDYPNIRLTGVGTIQSASANQIAFIDHSKYFHYLELSQTKAGVIILNNKYKNKINYNNKINNILLFSANPYVDFAKTAKLFDTRVLPDRGIHPTVILGKNCQIHPSARIGAYCVIGDNSEIGQDCCLWPHVNLYDGVILGDRVMIHSGAVLGSDGFGHAHDGAVFVKVPQLGGVVIGHDVEIGANTTIDRGALNNTVIGHGVKLDNQIQIAHNVMIGDHTAIAGCVAIAGSTVIGQHCLIGGGSCITGHIQICDRVIITGMTAVTKSITEPGVYSSSTVAQPNLAWRKMTARLKQLGKLFNRVERLENLKKI